MLKDRMCFSGILLSVEEYEKIMEINKFSHKEDCRKGGFQV